ncbi:MAG: hypothetical protein WD176_07940 [Pirellulales bacterium]
MRFYQTQHPFYCGVDLHTKTLHVCIVDQAGAVLVHRNLPAQPELFLQMGADGEWEERVRKRPSGP